MREAARFPKLKFKGLRPSAMSPALWSDVMTHVVVGTPRQRARYSLRATKADDRFAYVEKCLLELIHFALHFGSPL